MSSEPYYFSVLHMDEKTNTKEEPTSPPELFLLTTTQTAKFHIGGVDRHRPL